MSGNAERVEQGAGLRQAIPALGFRPRRRLPDPTVRLRRVLELPDAPESCEVLLEAASDGSHDVARAALRRLAELGGEREADVLRGRLLGADIGLVADHARTLRALGDRDAAGVARDGLGAGSLAIRIAAATALRELAGPDSRDRLLRALQDPVASVRRLAAEALGRLAPDEKTEERLTLLLSDRDVQVRLAAVEALARTARDADLRLDRVLDDGDPRVRRRLACYAPSLGRRLVWSLLSDPDADVRMEAAWALHGARRSLDLPLLAPLLRDPDWRVRRAACRALGAGRNGAATAPLVAALADSHPTVRAAALRALSEVHADALPGVLGEELHTPNARVRRALVNALAEIADAAHAPPIAELADDPDPEVRVAVVHALTGWGGFGRVLRELACDSDPAVAYAASTALEERRPTA